MKAFEAKHIAFGLWGLAAAVVIVAVVRECGSSSTSNVVSAPPIPRCTHRALPVDASDIIPPGDWCFNVGVGQTLYVNISWGTLEGISLAPKTKVRAIDRRGAIIREVEVGFRQCSNIPPDWYRLEFIPLETGGEIRIRVNPREKLISCKP